MSRWEAFGIPVLGLMSAVLLATSLGGCSSSTPARPGAGGGSGGGAGPGGAGAIGSAGTTGGAGTLGGAGAAGGAGATAAGGSSGVGGATSAGGGSGPGGGTGSGGTIGTGGLGGTAGSHGATGGAAGAGQVGSGGSGNGGIGVLACGDASEACCAGSTCNGGLTCLNGTTCSCAKELHGRYILRTDSALLYESDPTATAQTPVLDGASGLPLLGVTAVQEGNYHGCAVQATTKTAWCWRTAATYGNKYGQLGNGTTDSLSTNLFQATQVLTAANTPLANVVAISSLEVPFAFSDGSYGGGACAVTGEGKIYCWGDVTTLVNGGTALTSSYAIPITTDGTTPFTGALQVAINANSGYACAIVQGTSSKEVWCWGRNQYGFLGLGDETARTYPTKVLGINDATKLVASGPSIGLSGWYTSTTCALDGTNVRCWGYNANGETGTGATSNAPLLSPALVTLMGGATPLGNVVDLHAGIDGDWTNVCALTTTNSLFCWGQSFEAYPAAIATNVAEVGGTGGYIRYLTADGLYHFGTANNHAGTTRMPNCGPLH